MIFNKIWGKQQKVFDTPNFEVWRIEVDKGGYCSRHFHRHKFNMFYVESGKLKVSTLQNDSKLVDETVLCNGEQTIVSPGHEHMFLALENTVAYEFYWVELGEDIIRRMPGGKLTLEESIYTKRYFRRRVKIYHEKEMHYASLFYDVLNPKKVFDVGCALGSFLLEFKNKGCVVRGCDKYYDKARLFANKDIVDHLYSHDATQRFNFGDDYDLVLSIEVAEHLPPNSSQDFVRNITEIGSNYIIFTASNEKGRGHTNCREKSFWIDLFASFGFFRDKKKESEIVDKIQKIGDPLNLLKNLVVFKRGSKS